MRQRKDRNGYVLLMTIVLIAIAALILAGISRQSLLLALKALNAEEDLQRRWGAASCRQAVLMHVKDILIINWGIQTTMEQTADQSYQREIFRHKYAWEA
jgi:hypothetical protein